MNRSERLLELLPVLLVGASLSTCKKEDDEAKIREDFEAECVTANVRGYECYGQDLGPEYEAEIRSYCADRAMSVAVGCTAAMSDYYACLNALDCEELMMATEDPCPVQSAAADGACEDECGQSSSAQSGDENGCGGDPSGGDPSTSGPDSGEDEGGAETEGDATGTGTGTG